MEAISFSDARASLKSVIDRIVAGRLPVAVTQQKQGGVVMICASKWASIEETLYLLHFPCNAIALLESIAVLEVGHNEVDDFVQP